MLLDQLQKFSVWLVRRGRDQSTADLYSGNVRRAFAADDPPLGVLRDNALAPKTRSHIKAALRAWAKFHRDADLLELLEDIKLPPAVRKKAKVPFADDEIRNIRTEIDRADYLDEPMRAVLGLMAVRGLRVGDVLRMRRQEVRDALRTGYGSFELKGHHRIELSLKAKPIRRYFAILGDADGKWDRVRDLISDGESPQAARMSVWRALKGVAAEVGIEPGDVYPHRLRRTVASNFLEAVNGDLVKLQKYLNWQNISTAASYADHARREEFERIEERLLDD